MKLAFAALVPIFASLINLDHPGHYITFGVISISVANFVVVVLMAVVFLLAVFLRFPKSKEHEA